MANFTNPDFTTNLSSWNAGLIPTEAGTPQVWVKADAITGKNDGDLLDSWNDQSGNDYHLTQAGTANQPTYQTNELNGLPVVRFAGGNDYMENTTGFPVSRNMFIVFKSTGAHYVCGAGNAVYYCIQTPTVGTSGNLRVVQGADRDRTWNTTQFTICAVDYEPNSQSSWFNGVADIDFNAGGSLGTAWVVGGMGMDKGNGFTGDIAENAVYNEALSASNRQAVENYLAFKYQITMLTNEGANGTRDTGTKYSGKTASLKVAAITQENFYETINPGNTNSFTLSAYAYTDGSEVTSADCELFYDGAAVTTTFTEADSSWYRMTATVTGANANKKVGVQVKAGKTVYFNTFDLTEAGGATRNPSRISLLGIG